MAPNQQIFDQVQTKVNRRMVPNIILVIKEQKCDNIIDKIGGYNR